MKNYFAKEDGQGIVEYGLILSLVAIVSVSSLGIFSGGLVDKFGLISNAMITEEVEDSSYVITIEDGFGFFKENRKLGWLTGGDIGDEKDITIPNSMDETTIKGIYRDAFKGKGLTQVIFDAGSSVLQIHDSAFRDNNLSSIVFPDGLEKIDGSSFKNNKLTEITLPASVTRVEWSAFQDNDIRRITIGSGVKVYDSAFSNDGDEFVDAYDSGGAGTYVYDANKNWVKQNP